MAANVNNPQENVGQWRADRAALCVFSSARLRYADAVTATSPGRTCRRAWSGPAIERFQIDKDTWWLREGVTEEQASFYLRVMTKVRETDEWKAWLRRGSQSDMFLSGAELAEYIAVDERQLRDQFAEDGWLRR